MVTPAGEYNTSAYNNTGALSQTRRLGVLLDFSAVAKLNVN